MKDFNNKVAVVTGAASGIGKGLVEHCLAEGMQVVMADVEEAALNDCASAFQSSGENSILPVVCDVSKREQVEKLAERTIDNFGAVHLLFNNAGIAAGGSAWDSSYQDWEWVIGVNLWGVIYGVKTFMPIMLAQDTECHIVNTASVAGLLPGYGSSSYAVTKHGVVALTENMYAYLGGNKAKVGASVLCPGFINTNIHDGERNRPAELINPDVEDQSQAEWQARGLKAMLAAGMDPSELANIVFKGIRARQLYIQTHDVFNSSITNRAEYITSGTNPILGRSVLETKEVMTRRVDLTEEELTRYAGDYELSGNTLLTFYAKDNGLWFKNRNTDLDFEVIPIGNHQFEMLAAYEHYKFELDGKLARGLVISTSGVELKLTKGP